MAVARHNDGLRHHPRKDVYHTLPTSIGGPRMQTTWSNECCNRNRGQDGTGRRWPMMAKLAIGRVSRSPRMLKFIQKIRKSKKNHFFDFSGKVQKVALFAKNTFLNFSASFLTFRLFEQKFSRVFSQKKLHFSTFRAVFSLFDFSSEKTPNFLQKVRLFGALFSLFELSGKKSRSRTFRNQKEDFSTFSGSWHAGDLMLISSG